MITLTDLTAVDLVLRAARLLRPVHEAAGRNNWGRFVEAILAWAGLGGGQPWCAAFVGYVGEGILGKRWPFPKTASCDVLLETARKQGLIRSTPQPGDLFLRKKSANDADHTGFVDAVHADGSFGTIEGNTSPAKGRDSESGDGVFELTRGGPKDPHAYEFARWWDAPDAA